MLEDASVVRSVPPVIKRLLVIGCDFELTSEFVMPALHYLNALTYIGGVELTSIELSPSAPAHIALDHVELHDYTIVNSLHPLFVNEGMIDLLHRVGPRRMALFVQEDPWTFENYERDQPRRFAQFTDAVRDMGVICLSEAQKNWLHDRFNVLNARVVGTPPAYDTKGRREAPPDQPLVVVMVGPVQEASGVPLFSRVADLAYEAGLPWLFRWSGEQKNSGERIYKSEHVEWIEPLIGASGREFVSSADIFFLPADVGFMPQRAGEALRLRKRLVAFRDPGAEDFRETLPYLAAIYNSYTPEAAFAALKRASVKSLSSVDDVDRLSLGSFVRNVNEVLAEFTSNRRSKFPVISKLRTAALIHISSDEEWAEVRAYLMNLEGRDCDVYVTLEGNFGSEVGDAARQMVHATHPKAVILECAEIATDIDYIRIALEYIVESKKTYDILVRVVSLGRPSAKGARTDDRTLRCAVYESLLGTNTKVDQIINVFMRHPSVDIVVSQGAAPVTWSCITDHFVVNEGRVTGITRPIGQDEVLDSLSTRIFWARFSTILSICGGKSLEANSVPAANLPRSELHFGSFLAVARAVGSVIYEFDETMPLAVNFLRDLHRGQDIYVVGAGASCDYIDPSFFDGKCVIGVNRVYKRFRCDYVLMKEYVGFRDEAGLLRCGAVPVIAKWHSGNSEQGQRQLNSYFSRHPSYIYFDHQENERTSVDTSVIGSASCGSVDKLVVSYSSITSAMHLAAYMGAKNIILVGHDCGLVDGKATFDGYYEDLSAESPWRSLDQYKRWLGEIEAQTLVVRDEIRKCYNVNIVSLNPFVNFGLEGHTYVRDA